MQEFPGYDFTLVNDGIWWYSGGNKNPRHIELQDSGALVRSCAHRLVSCQPHLPPTSVSWVAESFLDSVEEFRQWLGARQEQRIAVVSHSGTLHALTAHQFKNGELYSCRFDDLIKRPRSWPLHRTKRIDAAL